MDYANLPEHLISDITDFVAFLARCVVIPRTGEWAATGGKLTLGVCSSRWEGRV